MLLLPNLARPVRWYIPLISAATMPIKAMTLLLMAQGKLLFTGATFSRNFPLANALQPVHATYYDAFVSKLSADGRKLIYSTYLGGSSNDYGKSIAIDSLGQAYVAGETLSTNFPLIKIHTTWFWRWLQ